ncbi:MAG: hypothetical protein HC913_19145, partial [Microscillaceae bacterium]|nr:hypothetical protein [Microscillaceae bacterium]
MYKVKVSVPATSINLGPGLHVLGLALSLQTTVDFQIRSDDELRISVSGEAKDHIPANFDNPALRAAMRVFQRFERAPFGLQMSIYNAIPVNVGFGLRTALIVGGLVAANNLIDAGLPRDELMQMALQFGLAQPRVVTTILGGLSICGDPDTKDLFYHNFEVMPLRVVAVLPKLANFHETTRTLPNQIDLNNAIFNIGRMPLLTEALCYG